MRLVSNNFFVLMKKILRQQTSGNLNLLKKSDEPEVISKRLSIYDLMLTYSFNKLRLPEVIIKWLVRPGANRFL